MKHVFGVQPSLDQHRKMQSPLIVVPVCSNGNISVIPLTNDDGYELYVRPNGGLEMRFSRINKLQI
jgi:ATP-dependent Clp protease ATP-binding subunit ClpA